MKKRWISAWLAVVMILSVVTGSLSAGIVYAEEENVVAASVAGNITWSISNGVLKITGNGDMPDWESEVYAPWFSRHHSITAVEIGEGITSIGNHAFTNSPNLTKVTISDSVISIGESAFALCQSLINVTIPDSVTSIGGYAFNSCKFLTKITIPDSVTSIGQAAFAWCKSLTEIIIPDSVISIGQGAFCGCSSLTKITIPNYITSIGDSTFSTCSSLKNIMIPYGVTSIGERAFDYCKSLIEITIPDSVTSISDYAFSNCFSLKNITIPYGVTSIGERAFEYCKSLTEITIPDSIISISDDVFSCCESLKKITIPDSVTSISQTAFYCCSSLTIWTWRDSYAWQYAIDHNIPVRALDDMNLLDISISVHETSSCTENDRIGTMYYACGNFFWDKKTGIDEIERTNYDVCYVKVTATNSLEDNSILENAKDNNICIQLQAPEGFSFEPDTMVSETEFYYDLLAAEKEQEITLECYPVYTEIAPVSQYLEFSVSYQSDVLGNVKAQIRK